MSRFEFGLTSSLAGSVLALALVPGIAQAQVAPEPIAAPQADDSGSSITVTGIRRSLESAQSTKRNSDDIVDSVVAEDIGKLPDVTASESLARVPGVQVTRNAGLAQGVTVRGLSDIATTYNGREVFTAEGRYVQLQDFPSNSIARIDVFKTAGANQLEPGIAGLIDVRSRRPFDFKGTRITGAITGLHWYQSQRLGIEANGLISTRWDTGIGEMGFLIEGSYAQTKFLDSTRAVSTTILSRTTLTDYPGTAIRYPSYVNTNYSTGSRWRPNLDAAFQWRPSSTLEIYADGLFQGYRGRDTSRSFLVNSGALANLSNIELFDGTNQIRSMDAAAGGQSTGNQQYLKAWTDTYQFGGGFIWKQNKLKITGDAAFTDSTYTAQTLGFNFQTVTQPKRHFDFDAGTVTVSDFDLFDASNYKWVNLAETGSRTHGRSVQGRLDADYQIDMPGITNLQVGVRYSTRDTDAYSYSRTDTPTGNVLLSSLPLEYEAAAPGFRNDSESSLRSWLTPNAKSLYDNADTLRAMTGQPNGLPGWGSPVYTGNEKTYSAYVQARYEFQLGVPIDGLVGLRATRTEDTIHGYRSTSQTGLSEAIDRYNGYNDFLPNVTARLRLTPKLQARLAFNMTRTRPGFGSLNPTITIGTEPTICLSDPANTDCIRSATAGNADLKPTKSTNYDASLEYYFSNSGSVTVGVFHKDVNGFINTFTTDIADDEYGKLRVTRPENGGRGKINGVEASVRTFLRADWLPDWLGNFGGLFNYTYLDHKSELAPSLAATLPGYQPIAGISKHTFNASAFYDNGIASARVSYNYRSSFVSSYSQVTDPALATTAATPTLPLNEKGRGTLDFAASVTPIENITVTFNATNLLGGKAVNRRTFNTEGQSYINQTRFLESVYRLGVRFRY